MHKFASQKYRVDYAVRVMLRGAKTSRSFDACFEWSDGDVISARIYKRALKNEKLMAAIPKYIDAERSKLAYEKGMAA